MWDPLADPADDGETAAEAEAEARRRSCRIEADALQESSPPPNLWEDPSVEALRGSLNECTGLAMSRSEPRAAPPCEAAGVLWRPHAEAVEGSRRRRMPPPAEEEPYICRWQPDVPSSAAELAGSDPAAARSRKGRGAATQLLRLCIGTMLYRAPCACVLNWILYHFRLGFERLILFFDDPDDPAAELAERFASEASSIEEPDSGRHPQRVVVHRMTESWWEAAKKRSRFYGNRGGWGHWTVKDHEEIRDVTARQQLCIDLAAMDAARDGLDWILHIDIDELLYFPEEDFREDAPGWFAQVPEGVEMVRFNNFECVPESLEVEDWFRDVTMFKVNARFLRPYEEPEGEGRDFSPAPRRRHPEAGEEGEYGDEAFEDAVTEIFLERVEGTYDLDLRFPLPALPAHHKDSAWEMAQLPGEPDRWLPDRTFAHFNCYSDGKAAARLQRGPAPVPAFVTRFVKVRFGELKPLVRRRADGDADPVVLHYANCGFSSWVRKYQTLGEPIVREGEPDGGSFGGGAHRASRELVGGNKGSREHWEAFYRLFIMGNEFGELPVMLRRGLAMRVEGAREVIEAAREAARATGSSLLEEQ